MPRQTIIKTTANAIASFAAGYMVTLSLQEGKKVSVLALDTLKQNILKDIKEGGLETAAEELSETRDMLLYMEEMNNKNDDSNGIQEQKEK